MTVVDLLGELYSFFFYYNEFNLKMYTLSVETYILRNEFY